MKTVADCVLDAYLSGDFYYRKGNTLRIDGNGVITTQGTPIGYILSEEDSTGYYRNFMILTLQDFKSQPNWKKVKKELTRSANKYNVYVIFVPMIDVFKTCSNNADEFNEFNENTTSIDDYLPRDKELINVAKFSKNEIIKTSVSALCLPKTTSDKMHYYYTYNQCINDVFVHCEEILSLFFECMKFKPFRVSSLVEPCYNCLLRLLDLGATRINYYYLHDNKLNTHDYIDLTNSIFNKSKRTKDNRPILFEKLESKHVNKFYIKGDGKI